MVRPLRQLVLMLVVALLTTLPGIAHCASSSFDFAESLYRQGDYYRAITEYKRLLFEQPQAAEAPLAQLRIGQSLMAGERWQEAATALQKLLERYPQATETLRAKLLLADIPYRQGRFSLAGERYREFAAEQQQHPQLRNQALYRLAWTRIERRDEPLALSLLEQLPAEQAHGLAKALKASPATDVKSPALAGTLSALLPGAGQLYTGHHRDAGLALALNAAFIGAAAEAFDNDSPILGGILVFFELGWYGGNIVNAVNHAEQANRNAREQRLEGLRQRFGIDLRLTGYTPQINLHGSF